MPTILIVEDEPRVADVIAGALSQLNYESRVAQTAGDALVMAKLERPDAILLDIRLPDSSGISTLDCLRQGQPDVPIIMVSALSTAARPRLRISDGYSMT